MNARDFLARQGRENKLVKENVLLCNQVKKFRSHFLHVKERTPRTVVHT